jgi:hypothetical protein
MNSSRFPKTIIAHVMKITRHHSDDQHFSHRESMTPKICMPRPS